MNLSQSRTSVCGCFFVKKQSICSQCVYALFTIQWLCKVVSRLTQFLTTDTALPAYMAYPKFLIDMTDLSETAKLVYILLDVYLSVEDELLNAYRIRYYMEEDADDSKDDDVAGVHLPDNIVLDPAHPRKIYDGGGS